MIITGVKSVEAKEVKSYHIQLDRMVTNGHDFCELVIDEQASRFTAILYGGECYTYCFAHGNTPFVEFLARIFNDCKKDDYLYWKLRDYRLDNAIDLAKTAEAILKYIENEHDTSELDMEAIANDLEDLATGEAMMEEQLAEKWDELFSELIQDNVLPSWWSLFDWGVYDDLVKKEGDERCHIFCQLIAPILADVLKEEIIQQ